MASSRAVLRSPIRDVGFAMRGAFQLAELRARAAMARELSSDVQIDPDVGYVRLSATSGFEAVAATGRAIAAANASTKMGRKEFFRARFSTMTSA